MSNPISALAGAQSNGMITVADAGLTGMITLRGDLASAKLATAVKSATGAALPAARRVTSGPKGQVAWMSPDELLLIIAHAGADAGVAKLDKSLSGEHALAVNVSDARGVFTLTGPKIRDVLAKGTPADMARAALPVGEVRRTRLGQLPVAFWFTTETDATLVCFRSVAEHVFNWLEMAARNGSDPQFHP